MKFTQTDITGCFVITLEKNVDERGFLARAWDKDEFAKRGINLDPVQGYTCYTRNKGTLRGFHYVVSPHQETKLTRVIQGKLFEVVLDLRPDSTTYKKWQGFTFQADDYRMFVTPPGCAHAVLTLEDNTEYTSLYTPAYNPEIERGIRFDDPTFKVKWQIPIELVSEKDRLWPDYKQTL